MALTGSITAGYATTQTIGIPLKKHILSAMFVQKKGYLLILLKK